MRRIAMANFILAIDLSYVFDVNFYILMYASRFDWMPRINWILRYAQNDEWHNLTGGFGVASA